MWRGYEKSREFEIYYDNKRNKNRVVRHIPTGREIEPYGGEGVGDNSANLLFLAAPDETPRWRVIVPVRWELHSPRARELGTEWSPGIADEFRLRYGERFSVNQTVVPQGYPDAPWDDDLVEQLIFGGLIYLDLRRFKQNLPPYPDRFEFRPKNVPPKVFKTIVLE